MFVIVVVVSILWANMIQNTNPDDYDDDSFP